MVHQIAGARKGRLLSVVAGDRTYALLLTKDRFAVNGVEWVSITASGPMSTLEILNYGTTT
jgi:hypothetical protein